MSVVLIIVGLVLLTGGAELLVRGATKLAQAVGMPALIIGLTVVAYGTSAPELAVSVGAAAAQETDIAIGNVVGSNTFNVLFILGLSALIVPLSVSAQLIRLDVPIMITVSLLMWLLAANESISRLDGVILFTGAVAYTGMLLYLGRRQLQNAPPLPEQVAQRAPSLEQQKPGPRRLAISGILVVVGLGLLALGARWLVSGATDLARTLGMGELLIGLTIVAAGTSMPEVATSVVASIRGHRDIAVGNVVGSNIFNILGVLGLSATVAPAGMDVAPVALRFDIPVMILVALACLPIFFTGGRIARWEGALFLAAYIAYVGYMFYSAAQA